jgi:hypothetical protein
MTTVPCESRKADQRNARKRGRRRGAKVSATPAVETARERPPPSSIAQPKLTERIEPNSQVSTTPEQGTQAAAAVTQKVVLYEENSTDPNGNRFVGSAIWHTETETSGPGQPNELPVRADVEVPERKLNMIWSLRRNTDKSLPASHTVEIIFNLPQTSPPAASPTCRVS